jgi:NAD-dependent dihydropyrimidine dehydrogenase PreA subunit
MIGVIVGIIIGVLLVIILSIWLFGERWRLMRHSTWLGMREHGWRGMLNGRAIHMYAYARWTNQYLSWLWNRHLPSLDAKRRQAWADHYHGKILTLEQAEAIVKVDHDINLPNAEQIIPYPAARDIIIKNPLAIAVYECGCRHARQNPCQPTQVCMVVGEGFVEYILEHNPQSSRRLTQDEALELLRAEHARGHLHSAWFKDACLNRFYAICNCCKCCCGGIEAMVKRGMPMLASSGYIAEVNKKACKSCKACVEACPFGAISLNGNIAIDRDKCMGCGVCQSQCKANALELIRAPEKGMPMDVRVLK